MGVTGLWKLIEPAGKPVPLETLENKVLAVDISIWIHQIIKGFQDSRGGTVPNAHLLGLFNRLCKLLYYRVKPVFVFDGGVPNLKIQTIAKRNQLKNKYVNESERIQQQILNTLAKHKAVQHILKGKVKKVSPKKISPEKAKADLEDDMFKLPPIVSQEIEDDENTTISDEETSFEDNSWTDLHTVDVDSKEFKSLPLETQYDILQDLKESRKQSSWGRLHELPDQSDDFSSFQMKRLRKRRAIQVTLDEVEREMGGHALSITDLEKILTDEGILAAEGSSVSKRIASDDSKKYLYIKDLKAAMAQARLNNEMQESGPSKLPRIEEVGSENDTEEQTNKKIDIETLKNYLSKKKELLENEVSPSTSKVEEKLDESLGSEYDEELQAAIRLSLQTDDNQCNNSMLIDSFNETLDESIVNITESKNMALARAYMMENSDLTQDEIHKIIRENNKKLKKGSHKININHILKNLPSSKPISEVEEIIIKNEVKIEIDDKLDMVKPVELISSDSDSDFVEVNPDIKNEKNDPKIESSTVVSLSSDSDSEFIEVKPEIKSKPIEIVINKDIVIKDDIFEDIFKDNVIDKKEICNIKDIKENKDLDKVVDVLKGSLADDELSNMKDTIKEEEHEKLEATEIVSTLEVQLPLDKINANETPNEISVESTDDKHEEDVEIIIDKTEIVPSIVVTEPPKEQPLTPKKDDIVPVLPPMTEKELVKMSDELEKETNLLMLEKSKQDRLGNTISEQMTRDIQDLLQLFGIPYIIAPMEAEAQCAFLNEIKLTDGTITDDSDIWLFGGKTVYKNFFDQNKYVMEFRDENIYNHFNLTREQLIQFALLVGSDYTTGLANVGPVTALEILAAFPSKDDILSGLTNFKIWFQNGPKPAPGKTTLIPKLKKVNLSEGFPSLHVVRAYLDPTVETSKEPFRWGQPDLEILREYTRTKFGWTTAKTDNILKPVIAKMNIKHTQKSIKDFFHTRDLKIGSVDKLSKRVQQAVEKLSGRAPESEDEVKDEQVKTKKPKTLRKTKTGKQAKVEIEVVGKAAKKPSQKATKASIIAKKLHTKEVIPQKEKDKVELLKNKMKAVEVYRKSKKGPGFVKNHKVKKPEPLDDANLSESSDE